MKSLLFFRTIVYSYYTVLLFLLSTQNVLYSQCTLNAAISGTTSVCTGSTTLTANVTGASTCAATEGVGISYNMDYCQFGAPYPATVTPSSCGVSLSSVDNFTAGYSTVNSCTQNGAEESAQSMCAPQSNSSFFNDPASLPNQYGFFFTVGASATSSGVLSKVSFYVRGSIALSGPVSSTLFGIRITDPSGNIVYYEQSGLTVPRSSWQQYTIDLRTDPDFVLSANTKQYRVFIQGYAPEPGFVPVDPTTGQALRTILEIDQVRVYYGCGSEGSSAPTYSWNGPNGFTSSQQSITATTAGTYSVTITDCQGCTVTKSVVVTGCANCSISSISATPTVCNSSTNTYSTTGYVYFNNPPSSGTLTVSDGTASQIFYPPFNSPATYTLAGLTSNGGNHTVIASFSTTNCTNSTTYTAPSSCSISNCSVTVTAIPSACDQTFDSYSISGRATILNAVAGSTITFTDGLVSKSYIVPTSQVSYTWIDYTLTGFVSNGTAHTVTAVVTNGASCTGTTTYNAPSSCLCTNPTPAVNSPSICKGGFTTLVVSNCPGTVTWNDGISGTSRTVSPTTTSSYIAICTVGTCTGMATSTVTVTSIPTPTPSVNSPTICAGQSASLTVSNCAGTVSWNDGTTGLTKNVSPTTTTSYTATCTVSSGNCTGAGTATSTVTVTSIPTPAPSVNSPTICSGSSATLTVSNCAGSVTWNDGTTGLTKNVSPTTTTSYTATCTVSSGSCVSTGTTTSTVTVTSIPTPAPSVNSPTICSGQSASLIVSNCAGTVTWNDGTTGLTKNVSPTTTASYMATCTVSSGNCTGAGTATSTVTVTPKPTPSVNSPTICAGSSATLTVSNCAGTVTWNDGTTGVTKTVSPTTTTSYTATCTVSSANCTGTGTATSTVTVTPKPTPSVNSPTICAGSSATLTVSNCAGTVTWNDGTTGLTKTVSPTVTTAYNATCSVGTCTGIALSTVTVVPKPTITINTSNISCSTDLTTYNLTFTATVGTVVTTDKGTLSGTTVFGIPSGQAITLSAILNGCTVTTSAIKSCDCPTINPPIGTNKEICEGDAIPTLSVVVEAGLQADWYSTASGGTKLASGLSYTPTVSQGDFYVEAINTLSGCKSPIRSKVNLAVSPKPAMSTQATCNANGLNYSVVVTTNAASITADKGTILGNTVTGIQSGQTVTITSISDKGCRATNTVSQSCTLPCNLPTFRVTTPSVCANNTWSVGVEISSIGTIKVNKGTLSGSGNTFMVSNIPASTTLIITDSLSAICKKDTILAPPANCNCITEPPILSFGQNTVICKGMPYPTLNVTVNGYGTVDWYKKEIGGTPIAIGTLSFKPDGIIAANDTFYLQARNLNTSTCPDPVSRTRVILYAQVCTDSVDLALKKVVNKKVARLGETVVYTLKVWNESGKKASGVNVSDSLISGGQLESSSIIPSRGTAARVGGILKWDIGEVNANGDTVYLSYTMLVTREGVHFNTAEICGLNEKDKDSNPCNRDEGEDDIDRVCFTVPLQLCSGEKVEVRAPTNLSNIKWYKEGSTNPIATGNVVLLEAVGVYTFKAENYSCATESCCPIVIEPGLNCCPPLLCIPYTIKKRKSR